MRCGHCNRGNAGRGCGPSANKPKAVCRENCTQFFRAAPYKRGVMSVPKAAFLSPRGRTPCVIPKRRNKAPSSGSPRGQEAPEAVCSHPTCAGQKVAFVPEKVRRVHTVSKSSPVVGTVVALRQRRACYASIAGTTKWWMRCIPDQYSLYCNVRANQAFPVQWGLSSLCEHVDTPRCGGHEDHEVVEGL